MCAVVLLCVCMHVCMLMYECIYLCIYLCMLMYECIYLCMHVCMVCMHGLYPCYKLHLLFLVFLAIKCNLFDKCVYIIYTHTSFAVYF